MTRRSPARARLLLALTVSLAGCGDDDGTPDPTPARSCVKLGDHGNDKGVGEYCTPAGSECEAFPEAGVCLAKVGQDQWFCTRIFCDDDVQCGTAATCLDDPEGSACVPDRCLDVDGGAP
jgi:hypothetical protein